MTKRNKKTLLVLTELFPFQTFEKELILYHKYFCEEASLDKINSEEVKKAISLLTDYDYLSKYDFSRVKENLLASKVILAESIQTMRESIGSDYLLMIVQYFSDRGINARVDLVKSLSKSVFLRDRFKDGLKGQIQFCDALIFQVFQFLFLLDFQQI